MFGGAGQPADHIDFTPAAGANLHGPPSIRANIPTRAPTTLPSVPTPSDRGRKQPVQLPTGDEAGWWRVHGGLGMVRWAMFLCVLVIVCAFGHAAWLVFDPDGALKEPGFLGKPGWPRWKEVLLAYTVGPLVPAGSYCCSAVCVAAAPRGGSCSWAGGGSRVLHARGSGGRWPVCRDEVF